MAGSDRDTLDALRRTLDPPSRRRPGMRRAAGPGGQADTPADIPPQGWFAILKRVGTQFINHRLMTEAGSVTFFTLLAIFPALAALVSLYGLFADPHALGDQLQTVGAVVPGGGMQILEDQLHSLTSSSGSALSVGLGVSLVTSLWSSNQGIKSLFGALNVVYDEPERRGFVSFTAITMAFTAGALLFLLFAVAGVVVLPVVLGFLGADGLADTLVRIARWPVLLAVIGLFLALTYRYGPSRERRARWRWITPGSAMAALVWAIASIGFSYYVSHFGSYNKTYGSLGAAVGFMTWIWLSTMVALLGAELDAQMENQTARDTTEGPPPKGDGRARAAA